MKVPDEAHIDREAESVIGKELFSHCVSDLDSATDNIASQESIEFVNIIMTLVIEETGGLGTHFVVGTQLLACAQFAPKTPSVCGLVGTLANLVNTSIGIA
jgi:hypothetical protein